jgi:hypothetical protein
MKDAKPKAFDIEGADYWDLYKKQKPSIAEWPLPNQPTQPNGNR